jgi:hypothetical protein
LKVVSHIKDFLPSVFALEKVGTEIGEVINDSLRVVAPLVLPIMKEPGADDEMLVRSVRRRVAARMDESLSSGGPKLKSWEHYLWPPVSKHLLTGDILQKTGTDKKDPLSFSVVLSPSCDLVDESGRQPKVNEALVACCKGVERILSDVGLDSKTKPAKVKEKLESILTQGYSASCLPMPSLPDVFPSMVADLRELKLIALSAIDNEGQKEYQRVASVDNPFRGLVSWAYSNTAARPGMPDRDFKAWTEEFVASIPRTTGGAQ